MNAEQQELTLERERVSYLTEVIKSLRHEKHDFVNHLNTINSMCYNSENINERIKQYITQTCGITANLARAFDTGNVYVDALLGAKDYETKGKNISLEVEILQPLNLLKIPDPHIISIIGNLIDNSIDSLESCENKNKIIVLETIKQGTDILIIVSDNAGKIPPDVFPHIFEDGFSTKTDKSIHTRGFGLGAVKKILDENHGIISVNTNENETEFVVKLPTPSLCNV